MATRTPQRPEPVGAGRGPFAGVRSAGTGPVEHHSRFVWCPKRLLVVLAEWSERAGVVTDDVATELC